MDFKAATDRLGDLGVTQEEIARACGVSWSSIRAARLDPDSPSYRNPPTGWRPALAKLARQRGGKLLELAERLEGEG